MTYLFGHCELDPGRYELRRDGRVIAVEPRVFDLLLYLVEHRDRLIGREELNQQIWDGRFVSDWALSTCIKNARLAIGDSGKRQDYIRTVRRRGFRFAGTVEVRGPSRRAIPPAASDRGVDPAGPTLPNKPSIAVLPFDNMSNDPEQEFFADGMTEDIITSLSKFRWFFVIARNSTFTYKGKATSVREVARQLGVRYILEGSVRKAGNRVRITAQLIDAPSGNHIWVGRYDRQLDDIFVLQDEITETIVSTIEPELSGVERENARRKPPDSLDIWERYQRGLWHLWKKTADDTNEAERLFQDVIDRDPDFAAAHAALAYLLFDRMALGWTETRDDAMQRALKAGRRAVSLDDKDPFAHFALGRVLTLQENLESAIEELQTALDLNPNYAMAHYGLGHAFVRAGQGREGLTPLYRAMRLSPNDPLYYAFESMAGCCYLQLREYEEAIKLLSKSARHPNGIFWSHAQLAMAFVELDRLDEAQASLEGALRLQADLSLGSVSSMLSPVHPDFRDRMINALRTLGLPD